MKVKFQPNNLECEIKPNETVLKVAQDNGIHIKSVCKGVPSCAECRVQLSDGEYNVIPPLAPEVNLIGTAWFVDRSRLACQLKCYGDITVDLTEQIEKAKRVVGTKRPRGARDAGDDYDPGSSRAVTGSLVLDDKATFDDIEEEEIEKRQRQERNKNRGGNSGGQRR